MKILKKNNNLMKIKYSKNGKKINLVASKLYGVNANIIVFVFVLYCIVLYCIVLYCIVLYCIVLYCIVLYCI